MDNTSFDLYKKTVIFSRVSSLMKCKKWIRIAHFLNILPFNVRTNGKVVFLLWTLFQNFATIKYRLYF